MGRKRKNWEEDQRVGEYVKDFDLAIYVTNIRQIANMDVVVDTIIRTMSTEKDASKVKDMASAVKEIVHARLGLLNSVNIKRELDLESINRALWNTLSDDVKQTVKRYAGGVAKRLYPIPEKCVHCDERGERHHPDYLQPDKIVWLCPKHHAEEHMK